jgi:hypothetical protein
LAPDGVIRNAELQHAVANVLPIAWPGSRTSLAVTLTLHPLAVSRFQTILDLLIQIFASCSNTRASAGGPAVSCASVSRSPRGRVQRVISFSRRGHNRMCVLSTVVRGVGQPRHAQSGWGGPPHDLERIARSWPGRRAELSRREAAEPVGARCTHRDVADANTDAGIETKERA